MQTKPSYKDPEFHPGKTVKNQLFIRQDYENSAYCVTITCPLDENRSPEKRYLTMSTKRKNAPLLPPLSHHNGRIMLNFSVFLDLMPSEIPEFIKALHFAETSARNLETELEKFLEELSET